MRFYYGNGDTKQRIIQIDGEFYDWLPEFLLKTDLLGDSQTPAYDLKAVYGYKDDMYLHLMVEFAGALRNYSRDAVNLDISIDGDYNRDFPFVLVMGADNRWWAYLADDNSATTTRGICSVEADSLNSKLETRIPLRLLNYSNQIIIPQVRVSDLSEGINTDFLDGPFVFPFPSSVNNKPENKSNSSPKTYKLSQNYPNPFNSETIIQYRLPKFSFVCLKIFNTLGQEMKTLIETKKETGSYSIKWDGKNMLGNNVVSGIYLVRFDSGEFVDVKKILLIR